MDAINKAYIKLMCASCILKDCLKKHFLSEERGAMNIIEIIMIIAVVLVIAIFFKDKIIAFVQNLWNDNVESKNTSV